MSNVFYTADGRKMRINLETFASVAESEMNKGSQSAPSSPVASGASSESNLASDSLRLRGDLSLDGTIRASKYLMEDGSEMKSILSEKKVFTMPDTVSFDAQGNMTVGSKKNDNKLLFSTEFSAYPDKKTNGSEISNDTGTYKELMLVGNKSDGTGTRNVGVWDKLTVHGKLCVDDKCVDKNSFGVGGGSGAGGDAATAANVKFTKGWTGFPDNKTDGAEISNDLGTYKTLMIVGNKSDGTGSRNVSVWDKLTVNGKFCIGGTCIDEGAFGRMIDKTK